MSCWDSHGLSVPGGEHPSAAPFSSGHLGGLAGHSGETFKTGSGFPLSLMLEFVCKSTPFFWEQTLKHPKRGHENIQKSLLSIHLFCLLYIPVSVTISCWIVAHDWTFFKTRYLYLLEKKQRNQNAYQLSGKIRQPVWKQNLPAHLYNAGTQ